MTKEQELRKHRCCFTGHRPEKLTQPETEITVDYAARQGVPVVII